ncbi:alpha/beta hydrolase [Mycobacterium sp. SM1]|uniref:alpha/beta fold hydrolase n=1 Tax=Mycobacterium sp. SM1 TaxID=2816243 RepID=UPI001BCC525E|nr:alpha/beta hydrolase [Mycobacterium sp. SM1]MBS4730549.1 alpha/beta hydrolase [Mycobacterium sp. SM1]
MRLAVCDYHPPAACHTVVFLHGLCLNQLSWVHQIGYLRRRYPDSVRLISYDHRGHGRSGAAPMHTYRIEQLADDLAEMMVALGVSGPLTLAGHSMGAMAVIAYLSRRSRPVEPQSLILISAAAGRLAERGLGRLVAIPVIDLLYTLVQHTPCSATDGAIRFLARPLCDALTRYGGYRAHREALAAISAAAINATPLTTKVGFLPALRDFDQYHTLGSIRAATTIISGGGDRLTPPAHSYDLAGGIPGAKLVHLPGAGHMILHEAPNLVAEEIRRAIVFSAASSACSPPTRTRQWL